MPVQEWKADDSQRFGLDKALKRPSTDDEWQKYQQAVKAHYWGRRGDTGEIGKLGTTELAANIPDDMRDDVSRAAAEVVAKEKPAEAAGPGGRTGVSMGQSVLDVAAVLQPLWQGAKTRAAGAKLEQAAGGGEYAGSLSDAGNIPKHVLQFLPMFLTGRGMVPTMSAQFAEGKQESLLNAGVSPVTAKWTGVGEGVLMGAVFSKLPKQLLGFVDKETGPVLQNYLANFGKVAAETGTVNVTSGQVDAAVKYASGLTGSNEFGKAFGESLKQTVEGLGPLAVIMTPQLARGITSRAKDGKLSRAALEDAAEEAGIDPAKLPRTNEQQRQKILEMLQGDQQAGPARGRKAADKE